MVIILLWIAYKYKPKFQDKIFQEYQEDLEKDVGSSMMDGIKESINDDI